MYLIRKMAPTHFRMIIVEFGSDSLFKWLNYSLYNIFVENDYKSIPQIH